MKRPTLIEGIVVAAVLSIGAIPAIFVASFVFYGSGAIKAVLALLACAYVIYLLKKGGSRAGGFLLGALSIGSLLGGATCLSLGIFVLFSVSILWAVRSLCSYSSFFSAGLDGGLCVFGLSAGIWAYLVSGSMFAALWCFFFVQAVFVYIPEAWGKKSLSVSVKEDNFGVSYRYAEQALKQLARG